MLDVVSWLKGDKINNGVLIILNQKITNSELFDKAWNACDLHVVCDGAANRLKEYNNVLKPDLVVGDFDSIDNSSIEFYKSMGVPFIKDEDKYSTDFMKSMSNTHSHFDKSKTEPTNRIFLAFGAVGGRVDHTWHSYLCLSLANKRGDNLVLLSDENLTFLLSAGEHTLNTPRSLLGVSCGYVPVCGDSLVDTQGFEWDVKDFKISFETMLSTSNHLVADTVHINTSKPIMITFEIRR